MSCHRHLTLHPQAGRNRSGQPDADGYAGGSLDLATANKGLTHLVLDSVSSRNQHVQHPIEIKVMPRKDGKTAKDVFLPDSTTGERTQTIIDPGATVLKVKRFLSHGDGFRVPGTIIAEHGVDDREQLASHRHQRDLGELAGGAQPLVKHP